MLKISTGLFGLSPDFYLSLPSNTCLTQADRAYEFEANVRERRKVVIQLKHCWFSSCHLVCI